MNPVGVNASYMKSAKQLELWTEAESELSEPESRRELVAAAIQDLLAQGLIERFRRADGKIAYRRIEQGNVN